MSLTVGPGNQHLIVRAPNLTNKKSKTTRFGIREQVGE